MNKDILKFQVMADAQKAKRDAINEARIAASPWLQAVLAQSKKEGSK
jgi:hypothetical protein